MYFFLIKLEQWEKLKILNSLFKQQDKNARNLHQYLLLISLKTTFIIDTKTSYFDVNNE